MRENYGFRIKLGLLCDKLAENDRGVLVLVDEVQASSKEMRALASTYQHLAGEGKNIAIVMAGLPNALSTVLNDKVLTFLNRARKLHLRPLRAGDVMEYYAEAFGRENRSVSPQLLRAAADATRGFPYLLQLIGYYLVEYTDEGDSLSEEILAAAEARAVSDLGEDVFLPTLSALSQKDEEVLRAIASEGEGPVPVANVIGRLGVSNSYFQQYRLRLINGGVIDSPKEGLVQISVPYLQEHLSSGAKR